MMPWELTGHWAWSGMFINSPGSSPQGVEARGECAHVAKAPLLTRPGGITRLSVQQHKADAWWQSRAHVASDVVQGGGPVQCEREMDGGIGEAGARGLEKQDESACSNGKGTGKTS